jgi:hypothetical protein
VTDGPRTRDVIDDAGTKGLESVFDVEVSPAILLELLWGGPGYLRMFPDVKAMTVIAGEGTTTLDVAYRVDAGLRDVRYVLRRTLDREACTITWRELGGDLRRIRGGWALARGARPGCTRVTYTAFVDVGKLVPTALVRETAKRRLGDMIERVRRVATSG